MHVQKKPVTSWQAKAGQLATDAEAALKKTLESTQRRRSLTEMRRVHQFLDKTGRAEVASPGERKQIARALAGVRKKL